MKNPPILVAILGFFAAIAGFGFLYFGLRALGFDWFGALGDLAVFENVGLWGWIAILTGIVWLLVAGGLWALQPWARVFAMLMAGLALFEAALAFAQFPGSGIGFTMAIVPALLLWYLNSSEVKAAFGERSEAAEPLAPEPAPAPMAFAATEPVAAPAVAAAAVAAAASPGPEPEPLAAVAAVPEPEPEAQVTSGGVPRMNVADVEGIGPAYAERLAAAGIATTDELLAAGSRPYDRERIAETTGISNNLIREWVDTIDLMRVPGVGPQYSDLLEAAGVGSPAELAQRNPAHLAVTVQEVVAARPGIVRRVPSETEIAAWIEGAGKLDKVVEH